MNRTERIEEPEIIASLEAEREGGHPIGHRALLPVIERPDAAQLDKTIQ